MTSPLAVILSVAKDLWQTYGESPGVNDTIQVIASNDTAQVITQIVRKLEEAMSKKPKRAKQKKGSTAPVSQVDKLISLANYQLVKGDYAAAVETCQRLLSYLPQKTSQRAEVLDYLGTAQSMLQNFPESYEAYTEALSINPRDAQLWYNRGMASRFTVRIGQSVRDFERAVELNRNPELTERFAKELKSSRELAEMAIKERGPDFTLDQLTEQEEHFQRGLKLMEDGKWEEAGEAFQRAIQMRDILPQTWGNLGICFMMQERYDEAEAALKAALEIDPKYAIAKRNLAALPETRRTGPPKMVGMSDPFKETKLKQSITFVKE
jgi:tetratricopeptide (TPR) repeat protein